MLITRLLLAAVLTSALFGQSNVGEISGQVSDPTGAAIPGCVITATHTQTGLKRTIETAETGVFVFAGLPEGKYNVSAEKRGFRTFVQTGVTLDAATRRNIDFKMEVGSLAESVSVSAAIEQVQTASGDVTRVISDQPSCFERPELFAASAPDSRGGGDDARPLWTCPIHDRPAHQWHSHGLDLLQHRWSGKHG